MATSTLCSLKGLPSVSYASTMRALSNKQRFPGFSRTAPSSSSAALAMVYIVLEFEWRRVGLLHVDTEWGQPMVMDISRFAEDKGVEILATGAYLNDDIVSIDNAMERLRQSGARIFIFVDVSTKFSLGYILDSAERHGIGASSKHVWLAWEENKNPEAALALGAEKTGIYEYTYIDMYIHI